MVMWVEKTEHSVGEHNVFNTGSSRQLRSWLVSLGGYD
jgi:hypothetical protein